MSRAPSTCIHSRRLSKGGSTDGAHPQSPHGDEQPRPENDTVIPTEGEEKNCGPSVVKLRSGIFPPPPSKHHLQDNIPPSSNLVPEAQKLVVQVDRSDLSELVNVMTQVLHVLQDSTIASKSDKDNRSRFWRMYKRVAEEHDSEFLERYISDMDSVLVFSGLFSAVSTSFIVAMQSSLSPNPSDTTNALLTQIVQIGLGNLAAVSTVPASTWSPSTMTLRIQMIAYTSLSTSLLAAFGAVLGKQWLGHYKSNRYGRGSQEERGKHRQEKFDGLITWYFDAVVQSFPVLLQISLLLFGVALGANLWYEQPSIAWVVIATTVFGFLFYSLIVMACLISPSCPFQTPISTILIMLHIDKVLLLVFEPASKYCKQLATSVHRVLRQLFSTLRSGWIRLSETLAGHVRVIGASAQRSLRHSLAAFHNMLHSLVPHSATKNLDSEAQPLDRTVDILAEKECPLALSLLDPAGGPEAPSIKWLFETSTDPEAFLAATSIIPQVEWPLDLDVSDMLHQLYNTFACCVDVRKQVIPSLEVKASACMMALSHLYYGHVLQAYPVHGEFLGCERRDYEVFFQMMCMRTEHHAVVLATTRKISLPENDNHRLWCFPSDLRTCPDSVFERLSHFLPYHFVTGRVDEDVETLAITVISKLLCPSSPSSQIVANCTLLACVMVGVRVDKKDIVRIDKSSALNQLTGSLLAKFQKVLWACEGGDLGKDSTGVTRRAWNLLDIICRILELTRRYYDPSLHTKQNLDVCMKIYSRARSSEQDDDPSVSLAALRKVLPFTFAAAKVSRGPTQVWNRHRVWWKGDSPSPEDLDWLVECLAYIYSDDYETAYDILLLLGSMGVSCSPAKQYMFVERLIACMDSNMPDYLRHAALRAAHSAREEMASIDVIEDAELREMILTKLSPAILSVVRPRQSATPADGIFHSFFDYYDRDLCYVQLVFALARNSKWHPHLSMDHHIDWCISMIAECCESSLEHPFYIAGILLQITPEQMSATSFASITDQQGWKMMRSAWAHVCHIIDDIHCFELLPVLAEGAKKYMQVASKSDLERLVRNVDRVLETLERRGSEQGGGVADAVKEFRTVASDKLKSFGQ